MGDIYTSSFCNIAATSNDPSKGYFTQRDTSVLAPFAISDPQLHNDSSTHIIGYDDFWSNSLLDSTLHRRGWALQERLLSPRTIHLGQDQLFWECRSHMACEIYPRGILEPFRNWRTWSWRQVDQILDPTNRPKPKWIYCPGYHPCFQQPRRDSNPSLQNTDGFMEIGAESSKPI
jgi:hypothetical protein